MEKVADRSKSRTKVSAVQGIGKKILLFFAKIIDFLTPWRNKLSDLITKTSPQVNIRNCAPGSVVTVDTGQAVLFKAVDAEYTVVLPCDILQNPNQCSKTIKKNGTKAFVISSQAHPGQYCYVIKNASGSQCSDPCEGGPGGNPPEMIIEDPDEDKVL